MEEQEREGREKEGKEGKGKGRQEVSPPNENSGYGPDF